jgi:hypothetical protein
MASSSTRRTGEGAFPGQSVLRDALALASTVIASGKHTGAQRLFAIAGSTRAFGEKMEDLSHLQAYTEAAADGIEDLAQYIDRTEVAKIFDDIGALAKRQPVLTAAFTLAAGIAVTQVVRNWRTTPGSARRRAQPTGRRRKVNRRGKH